MGFRENQRPLHDDDEVFCDFGSRGRTRMATLRTERCHALRESVGNSPKRVRDGLTNLRVCIREVEREVAQQTTTPPHLARARHQMVHELEGPIDGVGDVGLGPVGDQPGIVPLKRIQDGEAQVLFSFEG